MNTQSSAAVALRALVMLICLVLVPIAAIFGFSVPDSIKQPLERYLGINMASATTPLSEAPRFVPGAATAPVSMVSGGDAPAVLPLVTAPSPIASSNQQGLVNPLVVQQRQAWEGDRVSSAIIPAGYQAPLDPSKAGMPTAAVAGSALRGSDANDPTTSTYQNAAGGRSDRFTSIQQRLRDLGATYFLLESWGSQGQLYRFYCKMAIGGNSNYNRYFEATGADAVRVMSKVLSEVEAWRAGRQ